MFAVPRAAFPANLSCAVPAFPANLSDARTFVPMVFVPVFFRLPIFIMILGLRFAVACSVFVKSL